MISVHADDALDAAEQAWQLTNESLQGAGMQAPGSVVTVEAEAVPKPAHDQVLRPHTVHETGGPR